MKYCSKCGNELFDEAVVCPKCGCATEKPITEKKKDTQPNKNAMMGTLFIIGGILVIVLFVALVAAQL